MADVVKHFGVHAEKDRLGFMYAADILVEGEEGIVWVG
jgi:hypothetical protein